MLFFAAATIVTGTGAANLAQSVLLTDLVDSMGARCLDGTAPRYWLQQPQPGSANQSKWSFHFMGGGWCESISNCAERAFAQSCYLGSSNASCFDFQQGDMKPGVSFNETMDFADIPSCLGARWCGGLMMNDASSNPISHDWNKVLFQYCDGGSYAGSLTEPVVTTFNNESRLMYFRGFNNVAATLTDLETRFGLSAATDLILSGDSAGGLATYWHADYFQSRLPRTVVKAAPDSGFFFTDSTAQGSGWANALHWVVSAMNSTAGLNQNCVSSLTAAGQDPLLCARPEVVSPHIATELFVMNSKLDPALDSIVAGEGGANATDVDRLGAALVALVVSTVLSKPRNAAFLTSCHQHCGQWAQGQGGLFPDFNVTIDGSTPIAAFAAWLHGTAGRQSWIQAAEYPCATCCNGGQS